MIGDFFLPGSSFLHRFDPRAKVICLLGSAAAFFYPLSLPWPAGYLFFWLVVSAAALGPRQAVAPLRTIMPLLVLVIILTPLFNRQGDAVLVIRGVVLVTSGGLEETLRMVVRFSGVTVVFFLYFRTTELTDILLSLRWFGLPFRASLIVTVAFRYIPHLAKLYGQVKDAHTLRHPAGGAEVKRNPTRKITSFFPTLTSVLIQAVKSIDPLSMALEVKGVGRANRRTSYGRLSGGKILFPHFFFSCLIIIFEITPLLFQFG